MSRNILVIGMGQSSVPAVAEAQERDRWRLARLEYRGHLEWEGQLFQALAREDGWAIVLPWSWELIDAIGEDDAVLSWDETWRSDADSQATPPAQGDLFAVRP